MRPPAKLLLLAAAAGLSAPALAQDHQGWDATAFWIGAPAGPAERIDFLQHRITRGIAKHSLNRTEGNRAQNELVRIREMAATMRTRDGGTLNQTDRVYIQDRLDQLASNIHWMKHDGW